MNCHFDVVVLGAGAAGLMCAMEAARHGRRVALLDHADRIGKKILISGGGRCNFTNLRCSPENFLSSNPHFCKSALARYTPQDFLAMLSRHKIPFHEKTLGQLFCDRSARDIVAMLELECRQAGVQIFLNIAVEAVRHSTQFTILTHHATFSAPALVVATGGLSIPKMGATSLGYDLARQFGIAIRECRPALVPLLFAPEELEQYGDLAGLSKEVVAACDTGQFREKMLITHRGLSGPAILQISSYWKAGHILRIDLAPEQKWTALLQDPRTPRNLSNAKSELRRVLPHRLADRWLSVHAPPDWTNRSVAALEAELHAWPLIPAGTEGYQKAEVTAGGVDTDELSAKTMESRKVRGLFFIGEVVDVTGHLGGFNFQWAWASGYAAGQALAG
ncbi:MAG TPA: NAD(P)/FAD-dependent oxidoreductase [Acidobacteriaceae bacterium]|nr:NAD(P)/FAD-dependent oxidoreductase [Acidobacteriaceae bacterium]